MNETSGEIPGGQHQVDVRRRRSGASVLPPLAHCLLSLHFRARGQQAL